MSEETRAKIFQPLFTTKERGRGTGLGLVVVKQILQEHEAEITVKSEPEKGTTFYLSFGIEHLSDLDSSSKPLINDK